LYFTVVGLQQRGSDALNSEIVKWKRWELQNLRVEYEKGWRKISILRASELRSGGSLFRIGNNCVY